MQFPFVPTMMVSSIIQLTPECLKKQGIRLLMLDFDNTIVPYTTDVPIEPMRKWLNEMLESDVKICIVSNSRNERVKRFCEKHGLTCITHAKKPFFKGIRECMDLYGMKPEECALAGDQIYTDTLGANCCGVRSILVKPIDNHNIWLKLRHVAEMPFIYAARKRSVENEKYR